MQGDTGEILACSRLQTTICMQLWKIRALNFVSSRRRALHKRQFGMCFYCGGDIRLADFTVDHVIPLSKGGKDTWSNIVGACEECNVEKGNKLIK